MTGWSGTPGDFVPYVFASVGEGPTSPADVAGLRDVQCESCHGPARAHVQAPTDPAVRPLAQPGEAICQQCHDNERDHHAFAWATYRPKVVHDAEGPPEVP